MALITSYSVISASLGAVGIALTYVRRIKPLECANAGIRKPPNVLRDGVGDKADSLAGEPGLGN